MKTIVTANVKGGSGKTNLTVHLAFLAQQRGLNVGLIDLDPTASASRWIEVAGADLPAGAPGKQGLAKMMQALSGMDYVFIDTPAVLADYMMVAVDHADMVLIPIHSGNGDIDQLVDTDQLLALPRRAKPDMKTLVVINHTGRIPTLDKETREAIEEYGLHVAGVDVPFLKAYARAKGTIPEAERAPHYSLLLDELMEELK